MSDHVVETNVLLVASAAEPFSPFKNSDLPLLLQERVFEWLAAFRNDDERQMVWDEAFKIYDEYRHKLTDQDYGLKVVHEKLERARWIPLEYGDDGHAVVPPAFASFDRSDRKLLAAVLGDGGNSTLVNATDTDWLEIKDALRDAGAVVEHLIEQWLRAKHAAKKGRKQSRRR